MPKKIWLNKDVYSLALERMEQTFKLFDTMAVSFSGGKDSTAVLHVTLDVAKNIGWKKKIPLVFFDEEAIPFETEQYVRRVVERYREQVEIWWLCLPVKHRNGCSRKHPYWFPWDPQEEEKWVRPLPPEAIQTWPGFPTEPGQGFTIPDTLGLLFDPKKHGQTGIVLGIRGQESITRLRIFLRGGGRESLFMVPYTPDTTHKGLQRHNVTKIYPVYDWTTDDVWTAPKIYGWDYNRAYDHMAKVDMSPNDQRCAPPYGEEPMRGLWTFAQCFPDIWDKMQARVPGASTAARYAKTTLYGFGMKSTKMPGLTWKETLVSYMNRHTSNSRKIVAERLEREITRHYKLTKDPIVTQSPHPMTGVSWQWLASLASRGDLKNRRQPRIFRYHEKDNPETIRAWDNYRKEQNTWTKEDE